MMKTTKVAYLFNVDLAKIAIFQKVIKPCSRVPNLILFISHEAGIINSISWPDLSSHCKNTISCLRSLFTP